MSNRLKHASRDKADLGVTLIELVVGMVIVSLLSALSVTGWTSYQKSVELSGSARELVSTLRNAQQRSVSEAATYCVSFNASARTYQLSKFGCGAAGTVVGQAKKTQSTRVQLTSPAFQQANGSPATNVLFYPRGSATKGSVIVARTGSNRTYTITVEGLTGRVSLKG